MESRLLKAWGALLMPVEEDARLIIGLVRFVSCMLPALIFYLESGS
jgi:hypothetical protein